MSQPVTPRRVTRSSAADPALRTSPSNNSRPKSTTRRQPVPTDAAKEEGEHERSTVDAILEALPGRRAQAMDLLRLLAPAPALLLLLHGGAATGKTRALPSSLFATVALTPLFRVTRRADELVAALVHWSHYSVAFLASRNPATLDAALFDSTGGSDSHRRKRKSSQVLTNMKDTMAEEMLLKGPGTFPLERLLAIF
ncbi:Origin of replication complex subunit 5 [Zea mays]|uniref:Origin of replication complex subunit 5 n=1 Tax=Zea mays TaxID=4577 RepID=A0A1D6L5G4_MAIZE|nr:Origin of replication complex subunit 5 [Zea mays]